MDYLEFQCSECRCGLRIRSDQREKMIRCPNCQALQRYLAVPLNVPPLSPTPWSLAAGSPPGPLGSLETGTWSLRTPEGLQLTNLSRGAFEAEIRTRHLGQGSWFQGGDFLQWTPLDRLFQSQVPGKTGPLAGGVAAAVPPTSYHWPAPPLSAAPPPGLTGALPLEQQLPSPRAHLVLALGILGLFMPCSFIFSMIGLIFGVTDAIQIGNGTLSNRGSTMLTIGILACILGLFLGGCCTISLLS